MCKWSEKDKIPLIQHSENTQLVGGRTTEYYTQYSLKVRVGVVHFCADSPWEERRSKLYHGQKGNEEAQRVHKGNQEAQRGQKGKHEAQRWNSNDFGLWRCANFCCKFTDRKALDIMTIIYHMLVLVHSIWNCQSSFLHRTSKTLVKSSNWTPKASLVEPVPLPC